MASFFVSVKPQESRTADFCAWTENGKDFLFEGRKGIAVPTKKKFPAVWSAEDCGQMHTLHKSFCIYA